MIGISNEATQVNEILGALLFFLPAGVANMTPVFAAKLPIIEKWNTPLDLGVRFRNLPLLGDHKTIRGIVSGSLAGVATALLCHLLYTSSSFVQQVSFVDYTSINTSLLGFLLGFGALVGDAVKSFFKRQLRRPSGSSWIPFDQVDYIIGGLWFGSAIVDLGGASSYILIGVIWFILHPISTLIGFKLGLKDSPL